MFQFAIGDMFANPNGGNLASPSGPQFIGVIQDVNVEMTQKLVNLMGQNKGPEDIAPSDMEIKGTGNFAKLEVDTYNSLFFADSVTTGIKVIQSKEGPSAIPPTPFTITVTNGANWTTDLGVLDAATGQPFIKITSGTPTAGQYKASAGGVYLFAAADNVAGRSVLISYVWTNSAAGRTLVGLNHLQGYGPIFELWLQMPYQGTNGLHLFSCRSSKMSVPFKRDNYVISAFDFNAYPNPAGQWFEWFQVAA